LNDVIDPILAALFGLAFQTSQDERGNLFKGRGGLVLLPPKLGSQLLGDLWSQALLEFM
jgi:hypothetical protein